MAASTVNIAEFRYHPLHRRAAQPQLADAQDRPALRIVSAAPAQVQPEAEIPSGVYNIESARERHNLHGRGLYRPFPFRNRANLVRFDEPNVTVMRTAAHPQQTAVSAEERDLPPAA